MMEIVISLRPEWAAAILDGHKTLEVRTSGPCYIWRAAGRLAKP